MLDTLPASLLKLLSQRHAPFLRLVDPKLELVWLDGNLPAILRKRRAPLRGARPSPRSRVTDIRSKILPILAISRRGLHMDAWGSYGDVSSLIGIFGGSRILSGDRFEGPNKTSQPGSMCISHLDRGTYLLVEFSRALG